MDKNVYHRIENYMLSVMADSAHDKEHIYRVLANAMVIAEEEKNVDYDILICACLLHDIGRPEQVENPDLCHAQVGAEKAYCWLVENGFGECFAQKVKGCILTHRFRKNMPPVSMEAKILFDADKLDVVGAIGVARTLVYKGTVSDPLYNRLPDGKISDGRNDVNASFFQEYCYKLEKLYDRFFTQKGRELALRRRAAAVSFYENLYREVDELDEQGKVCLGQHLG